MSNDEHLLRLAAGRFSSSRPDLGAALPYDSDSVAKGLFRSENFWKKIL
jgi:hypothetical protein